MSLRTRLDRLERTIGTDHSPRRIVVWFGPDFEESWVERPGRPDVQSGLSRGLMNR
jgi:hypothetical protein